MAHRQVALLGCVGDHTTPLMRVKEDFSSVLVTGLGEGDEVWLEPESSSSASKLLPGLTPFPLLTAVRFSIRKVAGISPRPTSVEIIRGNT